MVQKGQTEQQKELCLQESTNQRSLKSCFSLSTTTTVYAKEVVKLNRSFKGELNAFLCVACLCVTMVQMSA